MFLNYVALIFLFVVSCSHQKKIPSFSQNKLSERFEQFGDTLVERLRNNDFKYLEEKLDFSRSFEKSLQRTTFPEETKKTVAANLSERFKKDVRSYFPKQEGFIWKKIGHIQKPNGYSLLMRCSSFDGLNYLEFTFIEKANSLVITDIYTFGQGIKISERIEYVVNMMLETQQGVVDKIDTVQNRKTIAILQLLGAAKAGNYSSMFSIYENLPNELKKDPIVLSNMVAYTRIGHEKYYLKAMNILYNNVTDRSRYALTLIDYFTLQKDYDKLIEQIALFRDKVGDDAALRSLEASVYSVKEMWDKSLKLSTEAIQQEPFNYHFHVILLDALILSGRYSLAIESMRILNEDFGFAYGREALQEDVQYETFLNSEEFIAWEKEDI